MVLKFKYDNNHAVKETAVIHLSNTTISDRGDKEACITKTLLSIC